VQTSGLFHFTKTQVKMVLLSINSRVRCCSRHKEYLVPVIGTFKFRETEAWCPYCGATYEFFEGYSYAEKSPILTKRSELFAELSNNYLSDKAEDYEYNQKPDKV